MLWYVLLFGLMVFAIWRMWARRGEFDVPKRDPGFDPAEGHPDAHEAFQRLRDGEWGKLATLYWRQEPSDRYHLLQGLSELAGAEPVNWPEDADSAVMTVRAAVEIGAAMRRIRQVKTVSRMRNQAEGFVADVAAAQKRLADAAIRNPHDSANLAMQLRAMMFAGGDDASFNSLLGRIEATEENNIYAAANQVLLVSPRRYGSTQELWKAANDHASNPPNAAWFAIPALAHIEEWAHAMDDPNGRANQIALMQDDGFIAHIRKLDAQFWQRAKAGPMSRAEAHFAHNHFAFLLQMLKIDDLVGAHLERIGPWLSASPWSMLPDGAEKPTRLLAGLRQRAGLPGLPAP